MSTNKAPLNVGIKEATKVRSGLVQYGTDAEVLAKSRLDRAVSPSNLAQAGFQQFADVTLTSAQVKALAATQIELVAAPGAGKVLVFRGGLLKLDYGGTNAFTESSITLGIKYTDDSGVQVSNIIEATGFIDATADTYTSAVPVLDAIVAASAADNKALVLDNLGAGEIAGNAAGDNTLVVRVFYEVVAI